MSRELHEVLSIGLCQRADAECERRDPHETLCDRSSVRKGPQREFCRLSFFVGIMYEKNGCSYRQLAAKTVMRILRGFAYTPVEG